MKTNLSESIIDNLMSKWEKPLASFFFFVKTSKGEQWRGTPMSAIRLTDAESVSEYSWFNYSFDPIL